MSAEEVLFGKIDEMRAEITRLRSVNAQMLETLRQTTMLRQLGGMLPGVRETILMVLESVDEAIAAAEAK